MSTEIVFQQMLVIFLLIGVGVFTERKLKFTEETVQHLSSLVTNVCNPAIILMSALDRSGNAGPKELLFTAAAAAGMYVVLIFFAPILIRLLGIKEEKMAYTMMSVYGNQGFIGIPVASAVLGTQSLIFVSIYIIAFNLVIYTHGIRVIQKAGGKNGKKPSLKQMVNAGTVSGVIAVILFVFEIRLPAVLENALTYSGQCTTFLAMVILGISVSRTSLKSIFTEKKLYPFTFLRFIVIPVLWIGILHFFTSDMLLLGTAALMAAMPVGNLPLMMAKEHGLKTEMLAKGTIFTTLMSVLTITAVNVAMNWMLGLG